MRQPHSSTLLSYTTLFRSFEVAREVPHEELVVDAPRERGPDHAIGDVHAHQPPRVRAQQRTSEPRAAPGVEDVGARRRFAEDRKSTRLNSSHRCISYAAFG